MRSLLLRAWSAFPRTPLRPIGGYIPCRQRSTTASCRARRPTKTTGKPFPQELREQLLALASNPSEANKFALKNAQRWRDVKGAALNLRLESFGIPYKAVRGLVDSFLNEVKANRVAFDVDRLLTYGQEEDSLVFFDIFYTSTFWSWACDPLNQATVLPILSRGASGLPTLNHMRRLLEAVSPGNPADAYPSARKMKRKFIMHVGPTNSGKTYHALRALASVGLSNQEHGPGSSAVGAYAGPLRLLAHEIWERLNLGLIKPLGVEEDGDNKPNPLYARPCNMVTGEEVKTVPPSPETGSVPLTALTLEMLPPTTLHSIVVIDEIQLLSDPERGWAWTQAVLGVRAEEVHLCGEESAVPLVRALLLGTSAPSPSPEDIHVVEQNGRMVEVGPVESSIQGTGDTLQVRKYARLTPLIVEKKSLNEQGGLKSVKAGDAIVTFSRSRVWAVKQLLEEALKDTESPQKCALVYGRLPSPVRSSQADLFNDPNSGFGVLVGSDAIGMGLNLKINRVIFDAVSKYDGGRLQKLSVSQVKQIGGRAGRYGMVQSQPASSTGSPPVSGAGYVTCMDPDGLPHIEQCIAAPFANLKSARIAPTREDLARVSEVLGSNSTEEGKGPGLGVVWSACVFIGSARLPKPYRYLELGQISLVASNVDPLIRGLSPDDMWLMSFAPMPWRMATPPVRICCLEWSFTSLILVTIGSCAPYLSCCACDSYLARKHVETVQPKLQSLARGV